ncbi:B-cell linker protein-like isoform X1 [Sinocyclocheilus rhinocerous]|uniref:B-cell linker protein-like isoform X1 n=1 Tax=Sinocyclocheilus rhinocerous TaxID=307959 RepID=UPI0007B886D0|nr:PREDICTED: B-cell linker protein-like isoform X1 [Sinocyclocheilus rhinocerous]
MSLPTREQCEGWSPAQVAAFLSQHNMKECAEAVQRNRIDGCRFLMLSDGDLNKFSLIHRPQLQKMVQDIKKNDDSLFNRLKRFQTEQTANILKTGRNTLDRIKKKRPPKVPVRDYQGEAPDSEKDSDSDFDSDTYEDPQGDHDDNYEPPPRLHGHMKAFTVSPSITSPRGEYVDSCRGRPAKPNHPFQMQQRHKPPRPTHRSLTEEDDGDYIEPEDETVDDNYIEPIEKTPSKPQVNRGVKPCVPARVNTPDFYEVPDLKENSQSKTSRSNSTLQPNTQMAPPKASPRIRRPTITPQEPQSEDEYEVCDADDSVNEGPEETTEARRTSIPTPRPRDMKKPNPALIAKPNIPRRDSEATSIKTTAVTLPRSPPDTMPATGFHRAKMPLPRQLPSQSRGMLPSDSRSARDAEEEAGVYKKVWYASSCDRKTAEDALIRSAKDSSFLLRKSSGVDAQQPYTLVVFYNSRVYNIPVRYIASTKQYALGKEKQGEERFSSVSDIIENHQKNPLVLVDSQSNTKDYTKLRHAVKP